MNDILQQIGITNDELVDRIVSKALNINFPNDQFEDGPFFEMVDKKIENAIGNLIDMMKPMIQSRIESIMDEKINKIFTSPFQPVNKWGEAVGKETTVKDMIADQASEYWETMVDPNGNPVDSRHYKSMTRATYYAIKATTDHYKKELESEVVKMAEELKARIPKTIADEISASVLKYLK